MQRLFRAVSCGAAAAAVLAMMPAATALPLRAADCDSWVVPVNGDWDDPANWSAGVPHSGTDVCITVAGDYAVLITVDASARSLLVGVQSGAEPELLLRSGEPDGASLDVTTDLMNRATITTDGPAAGIGVGGSMINLGLLDLRAATTHVAATLTNEGAVDLAGSLVSDTGDTWTNSGHVTVAAGGGVGMDEWSEFIEATGGTLSLPPSGGFFTNSTFTLESGGTVSGGPIVLTGASSTTVNDSADTPATFVFGNDGPGSFNGDLAAGQTLTVAGGGCCGTQVGVSGPFTNRGTINVVGVSSLDFPAGATNLGRIELRGVAVRHRPVTLLRGDLVNDGTIAVSGPRVHYEGTMTNRGTIAAATNHPWRMPSATVVNGTGGTITGNLLIDGGLFRQRSGTASGPVQLVHGSVLDLGGKGGGTFEFDGNGQLLGNIARSQHVTVAAVTGQHGTSVTSPQSLTNAGSLTLTSIGDPALQPEPAVFSWRGDLTNTGNLTIGDPSSAVANVGRRLLRGANLINAGTFEAAASVKDLATGLWQNHGVLKIAAGRTLALPNSRFVQTAPGSLTVGVDAGAIGRVVSGTAYVEGPLHIAGDPTSGSPYRVLKTTGGIDGRFDEVTPATFAVDYTSTAVTVTAE